MAKWIASKAELDRAYDKARISDRIMDKMPHFFPPIIRIGGKPFYYVGSRITKSIRDELVDNWRDYGYLVRVQGDHVYARRK